MKRFILTVAAGLLTLGLHAIDVDAPTCIRMALDASDEMRSATNSVEKARLSQGVAFTAYLPKLAGSATMAWSLPDYENPEMGLKMSMRGVYMAGINLTQPIFAGGKIVAANKMAKIGRRAANEQQRLTAMRVTADAETAYWTYVAVLAKVDMMHSYMAQIDTAMRHTQTSLHAGMATRNDLLRIEARRSQVAYQLEQAERGADLCRMALCSLLGVALDTPLATADTEVPSAIPSDLNDYDLERRPEVQLLHADIDIKEQQTRMTRAEFLPTLGLQAGWSAYGNMKMTSMVQLPDGGYTPMTSKFNDNGFSILISLQVPLFHWGEGVKKVKAARIDAANARLSLEHNTRLMNLEVQQAITNVRTGQGLLQAAQTAMTQAAASLDAATQSYSLGMSGVTELLDAQSQWQTSRANLIEARTQLRINIIEYQRVTATI